MGRVVFSSGRERGFTIVELLVVIVVLAILGGLGLAKFFDASDQAHESAISGVYGSYNVAANSARAQWIAEGASGGTVNFGGNSIPVSAAGWPTPVSGTTTCGDLWGDLMHNPPPVIPWGAPFVAGEGYWAFTLTNAGISLCLYIYRPTYPGKMMWFIYYANHATQPQWNGRIVKSGF